MGHRFEFEAPGFWMYIFISIMDHLNKIDSPKQFIHDKETGQRFALSEEEQELLTFFGGRLDLYGALKNPTRMELIDRTFDTVAMAFLNSRNGDARAYDEMKSWLESDWDKWIVSVLEGVHVK